MAPFPVERASPSPPFTHVGLDFTGHLFLKLKGSSVPQKAYVCIFTCASTQMVHFELTNDMTTDEFLQAFKRMYNRRDLCNTMWSDNQSTFTKAEYLPKLTVRQKWQNEVPPLQEGDVVLISEDNVKQSNWPLGMVAEVHEGADSLIRTVTVKTQKGNFNIDLFKNCTSSKDTKIQRSKS